jgi:hypothetical protein
MRQVIIGGDLAPIGKSEAILGSVDEDVLVDEFRGLF